MFRQISRSLALQFTGFVFVLFLINGVIFLAADYGNNRRGADFRLQRQAELLVQHFPPLLQDAGLTIPRPLRDRVRIVDVAGNEIYEGGIFTDIPFTETGGTASLTIQGDRFRMLTTPLLQNNFMIGYLQLVEPESTLLADLPPRAFIYLGVSILISGLTFLVGLLFAWRSLKPAEEMFSRLEQFTQDASHELRTPLAVMNSSLDVALKTRKYREGIVSAKEDLKQVSGLVERLLELARLDNFALAMEPVDLSTLVTTMVEKFRPLAAERSVTIESQLEANVTVRADEALVRQLISNLLSNAIKFNKMKGTVRVILTKHALSVSDTGIGIATEDLVHIFDRFYQADTSRSREGFGLGLALCKRITDLHGWSVQARSKQNDGTTFTVSFSANRS